MKPTISSASVLLSISLLAQCTTLSKIENPTMRSPKTHTPSVIKKTLPNGLTVLVLPKNTVQDVAVQLWVNVGGKHEVSGQKGLAHFIEHMIFKGTQDAQGQMNLSESDINLITHKLSGHCNAATSYDYTFFRFSFPERHWHHALTILADCMRNCSFKQDHINSELKAVVQELKMNKDNYVRSLVLKMVATIFAGHPYQYPLIGYKQDLWSLTRENLHNFYKEHYIPNNATLVVVGNVDPDTVYQLALQEFGAIQANPNYQQPEFYLNRDLATQTVTLYRDVQLPIVVTAFAIPGRKDRNPYFSSIAHHILTGDTSSHLHRKLVNDQRSVRYISSGSLSLVEHDLFYFIFEPYDLANVEQIIAEINQEIAAIVHNGIAQTDLLKAIKSCEIDLYSLMENNDQQAMLIGRNYLVTQDENYLFSSITEDTALIEHEIKDLLSTYCRPSVMHRGFVLPLAAGERTQWLKLQEISDQEDARILNGKIRESALEEPHKLLTIHAEPLRKQEFPKPLTHTLDNGLKVLYLHQDNNPMVQIKLALKAGSEYDSQEAPGLYEFMCAMLLEGTKNYTAQELAQECAMNGISISIKPGSLTMSLLGNDLPKGLELINEIVTNATFPQDKLEKVRQHQLQSIVQFWDDPSSIANHLLHEHIYQGHPYSKNNLGTIESITAITQNDLQTFYATHFTPHDATLCIVGDIDGYNMPALINYTLGNWSGAPITPLEYPALNPVSPKTITHSINRDQIVLCFAGASVDRLHDDCYKLLLFDQLFGNGMHSRLFKLREQTGMFYTIYGSTTYGICEQPGMVYIETIVSKDRLQEAHDAIRNAIATTVDTLTHEDIAQAKNKLLNTQVNAYSTNAGTVNMLLFLNKYHFPFDMFDNFSEKLETISVEDVQEAVRKVLDNDKLITIMVGRV